MAPKLIRRLPQTFPHKIIFVVSLVLCLCGCASIILGVVTWSKKVWGYYIGTGFWSGGIILIGGMFGVVASCIRNICTVKTFMIVSIFGCLASLAMVALAAGGLDPKSGFYRGLNSTTFFTHIMHAIYLGIGVLQLALCVLSDGICIYYLFIERSAQLYRVSVRDKEGNKTKPKKIVREGKNRSSTASEAPLVGEETSNKTTNQKKRQSKHRRRSSEQNIEEGEEVSENLPVPYNANGTLDRETLRRQEIALAQSSPNQDPYGRSSSFSTFGHSEGAADRVSLIVHPTDDNASVADTVISRTQSLDPRRDVECHYAQTLLFGPPIPIEEDDELPPYEVVDTRQVGRSRRRGLRRPKSEELPTKPPDNRHSVPVRGKKRDDKKSRFSLTRSKIPKGRKDNSGQSDTDNEKKTISDVHVTSDGQNVVVRLSRSADLLAFEDETAGKMSASRSSVHEQGVACKSFAHSSDMILVMDQEVLFRHKRLQTQSLRVDREKRLDRRRKALSAEIKLNKDQFVAHQRMLGREPGLQNRTNSFEGSNSSLLANNRIMPTKFSLRTPVRQIGMPYVCSPVPVKPVVAIPQITPPPKPPRSFSVTLDDLKDLDTDIDAEVENVFADINRLNSEEDILVDRDRRSSPKPSPNDNNDVFSEATTDTKEHILKDSQIDHKNCNEASEHNLQDNILELKEAKIEANHETSLMSPAFKLDSGPVVKSPESKLKFGLVINSPANLTLEPMVMSLATERAPETVLMTPSTRLDSGPMLKSQSINLDSGLDLKSATTKLESGPVLKPPLTKLDYVSEVKPQESKLDSGPVLQSPAAKIVSGPELKLPYDRNNELIKDIADSANINSGIVDKMNGVKHEENFTKPIDSVTLPASPILRPPRLKKNSKHKNDVNAINVNGFDNKDDLVKITDNPTGTIQAVSPKSENKVVSLEKVANENIILPTSPTSPSARVQKAKRLTYSLTDNDVSVFDPIGDGKDQEAVMEVFETVSIQYPVEKPNQTIPEHKVEASQPQTGDRAEDIHKVNSPEQISNVLKPYFDEQYSQYATKPGTETDGTPKNNDNVDSLSNLRVRLPPLSPSERILQRKTTKPESHLTSKENRPIVLQPAATGISREFNQVAYGARPKTYQGLFTPLSPPKSAFNTTSFLKTNTERDKRISAAKDVPLTSINSQSRRLPENRYPASSSSSSQDAPSTLPSTSEVSSIRPAAYSAAANNHTRPVLFSAVSPDLPLRPRANSGSAPSPYFNNTPPVFEPWLGQSVKSPEAVIVPASNVHNSAIESPGAITVPSLPLLPDVARDITANGVSIASVAPIPQPRSRSRNSQGVLHLPQSQNFRQVTNNSQVADEQAVALLPLPQPGQPNQVHDDHDVEANRPLFSVLL